MHSRTWLILPIVLLIAGLAWLTLRDGGLFEPKGAPDPARAGAARDDTPSSAVLHGQRRDETVRPAREPASEPASTGDAALLVQVRTAGGLVVPAAEVVLVVGERVEGPLRTDEDGAVVFASGAGAAAEVYARAPGWPLRRTAVPEHATRHVVVLEPGLRIAGRVRVGAAPPAVSVPLSLTTTTGSAMDVLRAVRERFVSVAPRTETDAEGAFVFAGLPKGWEGYLALRTRDYVLLGEEGNGIHRPVRAPAEDLVLDLYRLPVVKGRIVEAEGRSGVEGARVRLHTERPTGGSSQLVTVDAQGRFRIAVMPAVGDDAFGLWRRRPSDANVSRAWLEIADPAGRGRREIEVPPERLRADHDLGDLRLGAIWSVRLRVVDPRGQPVPGAVAVALGARARAVSAPTGEDGVTSLPVDASAEQVQVGAWGHGHVTLPVPRDASSIHPVELPRGNRLRIDVQSPSGEVPRRLRVRLAGRDAFFPGRHGSMAPVYAHVGATSGGRLSWPGPLEFFYEPDADGEVRLAGFLPDRPFTVALLDKVTGTVLASETLQMGALEDRTLVLETPQDDRVVAGVVLDPDGRGLRARIRATVSGLPESRPLTMWTDSSGGFRLDGLRAGSVDLQIYASGHVPLVRRDVPLDDGARTLRLTLEPGRRVTLLVVTGDGSPALNREVRAVRGDLEFELDYGASREDAGRYVFDGLPPETVQFQVEAAGRTFTHQHDARRKEARLVLPPLGSLRVRGGTRVDLPVLHRVRLRPTDETGAAVDADLHVVVGTTSWEVTIAYVLPGRYRLVLEALDENDFDAWRTLRVGPAVEIVAGEERVAEL